MCGRGWSWHSTDGGDGVCFALGDLVFLRHASRQNPRGISMDWLWAAHPACMAALLSRWEIANPKMTAPAALPTSLSLLSSTQDVRKASTQHLREASANQGEAARMAAEERASGDRREAALRVRSSAGWSVSGWGVGEEGACCA
jgi:hypothetical protein